MPLFFLGNQDIIRKADNRTWAETGLQASILKENDMDWKTYCENRHISFPVIDSCAGLPIAMKYVYPLKQKIARDLYYMFQQDVMVKSAWLFGSSVNLSCTIDSDTDIAIRPIDAEQETWHNIFCKVSDYLNGMCDIINLNHVKPNTKIHESIARGVRLK
jgi:predicted nucleotidyltransferase